jgi:hypothetical protein
MGYMEQIHLWIFIIVGNGIAGLVVSIYCVQTKFLVALATSSMAENGEDRP